MDKTKKCELSKLLDAAGVLYNNGRVGNDQYCSKSYADSLLIENLGDDMNGVDFTPYEPGVLGDIIAIEGDYYKYSRFKKFFKLSRSVCLSDTEYKDGIITRVIVSHQLPPYPYITANVLVYNGVLSFVLSLSTNGANYEHYITGINRLQLASHKFQGINTEVRVTRINNALELICEKDGEEWMFGFSFKKEGFWIPEKNFTEFDTAFLK